MACLSGATCPGGLLGKTGGALRDLGLTTVVDLREAEEAGQLPDELRDEPWLTLPLRAGAGSEGGGGPGPAGRRIGV